MTLEVSLAIALIGCALSVISSINATKDKSVKDGNQLGQMMQILTDTKSKVEEIWADKKATEKELSTLSQTVAVYGRDITTAFNKLDDLSTIVDNAVNDVDDLKTSVTMLEARLCKEGKYTDAK